MTVYGLVVPKLTETVEDEDELDEEGDRRAAEREGSVEWKSPALVTVRNILVIIPQIKRDHILITWWGGFRSCSRWARCGGG